MKRYLSIIIAALMLISAFPTAFASDITSVTISSGTLVPEFSSDVFNYDIFLESVDSEMPEVYFSGDGEIEKQAEYPGDTTILKTSGGEEYVFTVKTPYEYSATKAFSLIAEDSTVVQSASANSVYTANRDYVQIVKYYNYDNPATRYILLKFDLTGKNVDLNGKFMLDLFKRGTYGDGQTMKVTVRAANIADDWTYATATYNKTLGKSGNSVEDEVISFDVLAGSGAAHNIDISSIVRNRLNKGLTRFTLVLDINLDSITNVSSGAQLQVHFYNHVNGKESIRPALSYYPIKKGKDASLSNVTITDGIEDHPFSPDVYEYKIGVPEGKVPGIKFRLSDCHASAVYTPATQIGETATIKVTSHDETENRTYSFEYVSLADAGITSEGKVEVKNSLYKKGDETAEELFGGDLVNYYAELRNNNISEKNIVAVTVMKKNGVFTGVADICEATLSVGNNTVNGEVFEIPSDDEGVSLETYIFEKDTVNDLYIPITERTELPEASWQPQINAATEKIQYRLEGSNIVFYGKADAESLVPFVLVKPDCEISDFTSSDDSSVAAMGLLKANEDGIWEMKTEVQFSNKYYTAYVYENGELYSLPVLHTALEDKLSVLSDVYDDIYDNSDKLTAVSAMQTTLGLADELNINDVILGLDTSSLSEVSETALLGNIYNVVKELHETIPSVESEEDIEEFLAIYDYALIISKLNAGISVGVSEVITRFAFDDLSEIYSEVVNEAKAELDASLLGKGIETKSGMYSLLKDNMILSLINNSQNPDYTMSKIMTYGEYLGLDMAGFNSVQGRKALLVVDLANEGPYATKATLSAKFTELIIRHINILNSQSNQGSFGGGGSGGGGGSSSGGGSASISGGTGVTGAGNIPTDDLAVKPAKVFSDIEADNWAYEATAYLAGKKIISGMGDGSFAPAKPVKREEFAKILCLALNLEEKEEVEFADADKSAWYYEYICKAYKSGAILGIGDDNFGTGKALSRQDIAVIIVRAMGLATETSEEFADDSEIADYAKEAVYTLKALGVLNGTGEGNFEPTRSVTRAECAKIVYEVIKEME